MGALAPSPFRILRWQGGVVKSEEAAISVKRKRKEIEGRLGQSLRSYLTGKFVSNTSQTEVANELGVDRKTIRYYIQKWQLPYDPKAATRKRRKEAKLEREHLDVCICPICRHKFCQEARESHHRGGCVILCSSFKGRHESA